ncbi:hypothetical protein EMEDMD4_100026 [Sinorhizobium medicae]|uniref:Uncharacterized protein n=1 Tax=Sinorhizobium medicae TaxID=110321 RepID=A0A508WTQ2_9HYPH|nr:hypothetical protein EMEDMD4_100026 [Sinorhizobium medicae]
MKRLRPSLQFGCHADEKQYFGPTPAKGAAAPDIRVRGPLSEGTWIAAALKLEGRDMLRGGKKG